MSAFDPRVTLARPDLASETLRGQITAAHYAAGQTMRVITATSPLFPNPAPTAPCKAKFCSGKA